MKTERERLIQERERLKKEYGYLFSEVSKLLFDIDPMGISFEDNFDEYDLEVGTILPRLWVIKEEERIESVVREEFQKWFDLGGDHDLSDDTYDLITSGIHKILTQDNLNESTGEQCDGINSVTSLRDFTS